MSLATSLRKLFSRPRVEHESQNVPVVATVKGGFKTLSPDGLQVVNYPSDWNSLTRLSLTGSYAHIYASQYNVRTAVDVISRESATLQMHVYEKVDRPFEEPYQVPDARLHLPDHPVHRLLNRPSPGMSRYRFWYSLFADIAIYDIAYWVKVRQRGLPAALVRVPPASLYPIREPITQRVLGFRDSQGREIPLRDLVVFWGYDPSLSEGAVAPMETMRRLIIEEAAAGADREGRWANSARKDGVIERHVDSKGMSDSAKESFLIDVEDSLAGPQASGRPLMLEPGMSWNDVQWSPREMEYIEARKLSRTEVASCFHMPPAMMAAAANGVEPGKETLNFFYTSTLTPWLARVEREVEAQLVPEFEILPDRQDSIFVRFDLDEKLRGSFEERIGVLATSAGGPIITVDEARAREGLPPIEGGGLIYVPLNSIRAGGPQASPQSPTDTPANTDNTIAGETPGGGTSGQASLLDVRNGNAVVLGQKEARAVLSPGATSVEEVLENFNGRAEKRARDAEQAVIVARHEERIKGVIEKTFDRQKRAGTFKLDRWNRELTDDLFGAMYQAAEALAKEKWDPATGTSLKTKAAQYACALNEYTQEHLEDDDVFDVTRSKIASEIVKELVDAASLGDKR